MKYIFVDFEMNPVDSKHRQERRICRNEIIEIGAVMLNENLQEIASYKAYVKPEYSTNIYKRIEVLTGITDGMVHSANCFEKELRSFVEWCGTEDYEIYAWSENDKKQVEQELGLKGVNDQCFLEYMFNHWVDYQEQFMELAETDKRLGLEKALNICGIPFVGKMHDAVCDARNTSLLYRESKTTDLSDCIKKITEKAVTKQNEITLGDLIDFSGFVLQPA